MDPVAGGGVNVILKYARYVPSWARGLAVVLATIAGIVGFFNLIGISVPFTSSSSDAQLIEKLLENVERLPEYLADLETTQKDTLRAAYEEGRRLQLEGYEAQNEEKHREAIDRLRERWP